MSTPYDYYPAVLYAINALGQGRTLSDACDQANITVQTFRSYVSNDPTLQALFEDAEQRSYDAMADALINIDNHKLHGQSNPQMAKVISDNIKWVLSKRKPKEYGERIEVKHEHTLDITITSALNRARQRTVAIEDTQDVIDGEVVRVFTGDDAHIMHELFS